jgi:hypothetical protein
MPLSVSPYMMAGCRAVWCKGEGTSRMSIISWVEANLLRDKVARREQDLQRLSVDLRKLMADVEALRAQSRTLRREIADALAVRG